MTITALPTPPSRANSPADFATKADALLSALPAFVTETNATADNVVAKEATAVSAAATATSAASTATAKEALATSAATTATEKAAIAVAAADAAQTSGSAVALQASLLSSSGSSLLGFLPAGTGAVATDVQSKLRESVTFDDFGAVGDGVTDDSAEIQAALVYAFATKKNIKGTGKTYAIGTTLIIPQYFDFTSAGIEIDCGNCRFKMLSDTTLFTSGYDNGGVLTTNYGTALMSHYSQGITLKNFTIESAVGNLTHPALKIQDWFQGSLIANISSLVCQQMLWSRNNFYCSFDNIRSLYDGAKTGARFVFSENHNLNKISRLVALNAVTGYRFDGPVTALQMTNISFEGQTYGVEFNASVYDVSIENSYAESVSDTVVVFSGPVIGATFRNNYVNFGNSATSYLFSYLPGSSNNIRVASDNTFVDMPSVANLIKNRENSYGRGIVIERYAAQGASFAELRVDNAVFGQNIKWDQEKHFPGFIGNTVNSYIPGNYVGKYTNGFGGANGFEWIDNSSNILTVRTRIDRNFVCLVYVAITVSHSAGPTIIKGMFVGDTFYEFKAAGLVASTALVAGNYLGFLQIDGGVYYGTTVTGVTGEVRII